MAKAKKSEPQTAETSEFAPKSKTPAARKAAAGKSAKAPAAKLSKPTAKPAAGGFSTLIDTDLAAQSAARLVANRAALSGAAAGGVDPTLQQIKRGLTNPAASISSILGGESDALRRATGHGEFGKQSARNQTSGGDAGRTGVPRRTSG